MADAPHIVCPHCIAVNRVPAVRLHDRPNCGHCHRALFEARPVDLDASSLPVHTERNDIPLLIDFWATWCGPCRTMAPAYARAAQELEPRVRLARLETDAVHTDIDFVIRSIPTLVLLHRGREIARQSGVLGAAEIQRWTRTHLP